MFLKELRTRKGLTLREFCDLANLDYSNWSKVERGLLQPPKDSKVINDIASALLIEKDTENWYTLLDLAAIGHIPPSLIAENAVNFEDNLTVFFRAARNASQKAPTPRQYRDMINCLKTNPQDATPNKKPGDKDKKGNKD
jgi:transcriptional regulator with XRE-family HTH domain